MEEEKNNIIKVEVSFRGGKRMIYSVNKGAAFALHELVIAEVEKGTDIGQISIVGKLAELKKCEPHQLSIVRHAGEDDLARFETIRNDERDAFFVGRDKIRERQLDMVLTEVEKQFDESKITFYFLAEHRVDFRDLVKDLAGHFKTRIELRQIGVRDEAKRYDGVGVCGRRLCCAGWLNTFDQISTQMARVQHLSLNQSKLSGNCGRLKCCLKFEVPLYEEINACVPQYGSVIKTAKGDGKVVGLSMLKGQAKVSFSDTGDLEMVDLDNCQKLLFPERNEIEVVNDTPVADIESDLSVLDERIGQSEEEIFDSEEGRE